ncbi:putative FCP1 y domain-containing protein like [Verticillium longisporum]|nr:putative FCP1 y domain-containing protein like [Verticillium longisporum]KAG7127811.1 putative FCP1 y domain-containing protein like [Verticillium longisporum]
MEYNSFRGNAAPGGGNFAMQPSQMPSFYFDTTPSGTSQFHSGPSFPAPTAPHGGIQTNQPVSIPTGPAAMTRLPPPNAPTEPKGKLNKKAKARGEKGIKRKIKNNNGATEERDKVVAPSAASGGIPNPTPAYLRQAHNPPTTLARPRAILVVLDLNGTLLHRPDRRRSHNFIERPYAKRFMHYCIDTLHVAVWSSARPENVAKMVAQLAEGGGDVAPAAYASRLVAAWGRDKFDLTPADYVKRVQCYKRLQRIWADAAVQASHPDGLRWDQTNTVLVDDSLEKARSEPFNLLRITEFFGDANEATDVLPQVHDYINTLCYQADISQYMRLHPFGLRDDYTLERPPSA